MKGNTVNQFMDDVIACGGPQKEFLFNGKNYLLETIEENSKASLKLFLIKDNKSKILFSSAKPSYQLRAEEFEKAKVFDGKSIYEAEKDIDVIFG